MQPAVTSLVHTHHPLVKASAFEATYKTPLEIEFLWSIYNALPDHAPRLERSKAATNRLFHRRKQTILPPRRAFQTTVDYYEACLPLYRAQKRFALFCPMDGYFRCVQQALKSILPAKLF